MWGERARCGIVTAVCVCVCLWGGQEAEAAVAPTERKGRWLLLLLVCGFPLLLFLRLSSDRTPGACLTHAGMRPIVLVARREGLWTWWVGKATIR